MNKVRDNGNAAAVPSVNGSLAQGILVLGMHRSGTSACTRVLNLLGCALPSQLLGEGEGNETGHWESTEVLSLNEEMLESAGSSHDDWGPLNADWRKSAIRSQMVLRASTVLADHAKLGPLFAIKDPRICRLADVWLEAAIEVRVEPLIILMLRNPVEVAASLEARDLMATGYGELLWLRHVLDGEFYSRGRTRVICRYDQLLNNWQGLIAKIKSELSIAFPRNSPKTQVEISQFLSQSHRHHSADPALVIDDPGYSHWLRRTFEIMLAWSERGEDASDFPVLDEIRDELDRAYGALAKLLLAQELSGAAGLAGQLRGELTALRDESHREAETLRAAAAQRETELAERAAELARLQSALSDTNAEAEVERERRAEAEERLVETSRDLQEQQLRNAELAGQVSAAQSALIQRQEELAQFLNQFHEAECARARAEQRVDDLSTGLAQLTVLLQEQEQAAEKATREKSDFAAETLRLSDEVLQLRQAIGSADTARADSERRLTDRFNELARLTAIVAEESERAIASANDVDWLRNTHRLEESFPAWWAIMPRNWRQRRIHRRFRRAGLFDAQAYVELYPDVLEEGMDPIRHYILHGMAEGRTRPQPS